MPSPRSTNLLRDSTPALIVAAITLTIWIALRTTGPLKGDAFFGWLCLLLIAATAATITHTAYASTARRARQGLLILCASTIALAATTALSSGHVAASETVTLSAVTISWLLLAAAITWSLRKLSAPTATAIALAITTLLMASPVAALPLIRSAATWGQQGTAISPWQGRIIELVRDTNPFLALLDAVRPSLKIDWSHLPGMYEWSGLGQDIPMLLPNAWIWAGIHGALTALLLGVAVVGKPRRAST